MNALADIEQQIAELEKKKQQLIKAEKEDALRKVKDALAQLNALGYSYSLSENANAAPRKRRTGIRDEVLKLIEEADDIITRSEIIDRMHATSKSAQQSISNAISALKKTGRIEGDRGEYRKTQP